MSEKELVDKTNEVIAELVYDKFELQKAYNYYNSKRDPEQFKYLEENFGIIPKKPKIEYQLKVDDDDAYRFETSDTRLYQAVVQNGVHRHY